MSSTYFIGSGFGMTILMKSNASQILLISTVTCRMFVFACFSFFPMGSCRAALMVNQITFEYVNELCNEYVNELKKRLLTDC